ncbi:MAG: hypothetical protein KDA75_12685, partial [Planctomycetaceae bacterium]|nr:hypothetical protein [Planctomycetaceae bacterium]
LRSPWLDDFRRAHRYAPALGEFVTFEKFFSETDLDGRMSEFRRGNYLSPFLVQAVAKREASPISRYVEATRRRRRFEASDFSQATAGLLHDRRVLESEEPNLESCLADAGPDLTADAAPDMPLDDRLAQAQSSAAQSLARLLTTSTDGHAGLLVINPLSFARKAVVDWPESLSVPAAESPVVARQFSDTSRQIVVDVPPSGFCWVQAPTAEASLPAASKVPMAEELVVRNEFMEITLSDATGGISQVRTYGRGGNRLSQQLAWRFSREKTVTYKVEEETSSRKTWYSDMVLREQRVLSAGPAWGAVETVGDLLDPTNGKLLATFRQRVSLWRGRPFADVEIELGLEKTPEGDPWTNYLGCRFAWNDSSQTLTRSMQETAWSVKDEQRLESPSFLELASESHRTTILTGGLAFHRVTGPRMLDTLLVTEGEQHRTFRFAIAIDQNYPMAAALDWETPVISIPTTDANAPVPTGWLFQVGARNVQLRRILPLTGAEAGKAGCIVRLQETEGKNKTFKLGCFLTPTRARQVDLDGQSLHTFKIENGAALVSIAPYELCDVELRFE